MNPLARSEHIGGLCPQWRQRRREGRLRLRDCHIGLQETYAKECSIARVITCERNLDRQPDLGPPHSGYWDLESVRKNAHDSVRLAVESNGSPQDVIVSPKTAAPEAVAQKSDMSATWLTLLR